MARPSSIEGACVLADDVAGGGSVDRLDGQVRIAALQITTRRPARY